MIKSPEAVARDITKGLYDPPKNFARFNCGQLILSMKKKMAKRANSNFRWALADLLVVDDVTTVETRFSGMPETLSGSGPWPGVAEGATMVPGPGRRPLIVPAESPRYKPR